MSARRAGPAPGGSPEVLWSLLVIAAALVGGLAAAEIVHTFIAVTLIVSVAAAAIAIFALIRWPGPAPIQESEAGPSRRPPVPPGPGTRPVPGPRPDPVPPELDGGEEAETVVQLLPANPQQAGDAGGADWWQRNLPAPPPSQGARRAPAPDLSSYLSFTQIAQCPNCGAFGLEIGHVRGGWGFRCESCAHTWTWRPGTPWPQIRVAPGRRTQERPPS